MNRTARVVRHRQDAVGMGVLSLFDMTGLIMYRMMRRRLAAAKPDESPAESFRSSARLIFEARREVAEASRGTNR